MTLESKNKKGIVSFFANLPLIRRIKIVKELTIEKLDEVLARSNNLDSKINTVLNNDSFLLEATILIVKTLKTIYEQSNNYYNNLVKTIQENSQKYYDNLTQFIQENSHKYYDNLTQFIQENSHKYYDNLTQFIQENSHKYYDNLTQFIQENSHKYYENLTQFIQENSHKYYENLTQFIQDTNKNLPTLLEDSQSQNNKLDILETQLTQVSQDLSKQISIVTQQIINAQDMSEKCLTQQQEIENILNSFNSKKIIINDSSYTLNNPEIGLMMYLYSFLPNRYAIDIGANIGNVSESLLNAGYEVYSFEPFLPTYEKLTSRLENNPYFHSYQIALGATNETREFYLATDKTADKIYQDSSLYNSLIKHSMPDDLPFTDTTTVTVKTLASFHDNKEIPNDIGLVKIDTEGFDLQVIEGMGLYKYPVVITEFWDEHIPFGISQTHNKLDDLVFKMRDRNYHWYIVMYRVWGDVTGSITPCHDAIAFYCNNCHCVKNSWGNIFFFQDYELFQQANRWTTSILPETYFR